MTKRGLVFAARAGSGRNPIELKRPRTTHHESRTPDRGTSSSSSSAEPERPAPSMDNTEDDPVAFLNQLSNGPFGVSGGEGALPVSVTTGEKGPEDEPAGAYSAPALEPPEIGDCWEHLPVLPNGPELGIVGLEESATSEFRSNEARASESGTAAVGGTHPTTQVVTAVSAVERLSNCNIPPTPQETDPCTRPRIEDIIKSLTKFLNGCKDDKQSLAAPAVLKLLPSYSLSYSDAIASPSSSSAVAANTSFAAIASTSSSHPIRSLPLESNPCDLRPVCEIRPMIDVTKLPRPVESSSRSRSRQGGGGNRSSGGSRSRSRAPRQSRASSSRSRSARNRAATQSEPVRRSERTRTLANNDAAAAAAAIEAAIEAAASAPSTSTAAAAEEQQRLTLAVDGLEIIDQLAVTSMSEEAAAAAASLINLDLF